MRFQAPRLRVCLSVVLLVFGFSFLPVRVSADHEIEETKEAIAKSIRKTFDDFNNDDYLGFIDGFTDLGFLNKKLFAMHVETPVPKDEIAVFFGAMKLKGPVTVRNLSNIRILDHAMVQATAQIEIQQGHVRERYGLWMVKRLGLDKRRSEERRV